MRAVSQAAREQAATAACEELKVTAAAARAGWLDEGCTAADTTQLQKDVLAATLLIVAAWPNPNTRPAIVKEADGAVQQAMDVAQAVKERIERQARHAAAVDALTKLRDDAAAAAAAWQDRPPTSEEWQALEAAHAAAQAMLAASPDPVHKALSDEATAAVAEARAAKERADMDAQRATVVAALAALTDQANAAAAAWRDRPPSDEERAALKAAIAQTQAVLNAHPHVSVLGVLAHAEQAVHACVAAWAAAAAAQAQQRQAAAQALDVFIQRVLLYAARWSRKGRRRAPRIQKYDGLCKKFHELTGVVLSAFPAAYAYHLAVLKGQGADIRGVPVEEFPMISMLGSVHEAMLSLERVMHSWHYATSMHGAAGAA